MSNSDLMAEVLERDFDTEAKRALEKVLLDYGMRVAFTQAARLQVRRGDRLLLETDAAELTAEDLTP